MKCFNITDAETPELRARKLVNTTLAVHSILIPPGESADVPDDEVSRQDAASYVLVGALAVDTLPPAYALHKERERRAAIAEPEPVRRRRG